MHILLLGASGRTGLLTTSLALEAGHTVTALVRNPSSILSPLKDHPSLHLVKGTPLQQQDLEIALTSPAAKKEPIDAIVSTLNASRKTDSPFAEPLAPPMFVWDSVMNAITVAGRHSPTSQQEKNARVVIMSAFGTGSSFAQLPWVMKLLFSHSNMKISLEDHDALDSEIRKMNEIDWLLVRPTRLTDGPQKEVKELGEEGKGAGWSGSVSRASVAKVLVEGLEGGRGWGRGVVVAE